MNVLDSTPLPAGPALPPEKTMAYKTKRFGKTVLRIVNEQALPSSISIDGIGYFVPAATEDKFGFIDLSNLFYFGKVLMIKNQSDWVLKIESR